MVIITSWTSAVQTVLKWMLIIELSFCKILRNLNVYPYLPSYVFLKTPFILGYPTFIVYIILMHQEGLNMIRIHVYIEESTRKALRTLALQTGKKQSELIREAIDTLIATAQNNYPNIRLQKAKGLWINRHDLKDFEDMKRDWERRKT